jgi:hypothetical protein
MRPGNRFLTKLVEAVPMILREVVLEPRLQTTRVNSRRKPSLSSSPFIGTMMALEKNSYLIWVVGFRYSFLVTLPRGLYENSLEKICT